MKYLAALALAAISTPVLAQAVAGPDSFVTFASQVANNVDQDRAGLVWDRASPELKGATPKDRFVSQIRRKQQQNGTPTARVWQSIVRSTGNGGRQQLVTVTFAVTTDKNTTFNEVVQFIAAPGNVWRTSAYIN